jgi:hypothetical protein
LARYCESACRIGLRDRATVSQGVDLGGGETHGIENRAAVGTGFGKRHRAARTPAVQLDRQSWQSCFLAAIQRDCLQPSRRRKVGAVSINDGSLTSMVWEAEKSSFGLSGLGPSRMGDSELLRFLRRQALIRQSGPPASIAAYAESGMTEIGPLTP